jgi:exopolysaccharide biosynthesis polyprenyl glycosylphosphotransferase
MPIALALVEAALMFAALVTLLIRTPVAAPTSYAAPAFEALVLTLACVGAFYYCDLYDFRVARSVRTCAPRLLKALGLVLVAVAAADVLLPTRNLAEALPVASVLLLAAVLPLGARAACYGFIRTRPYAQTVLLLGGGRLARMLADEIAARPHLRWAVGVVTDGLLPASGVSPFRYPVLGGLDRLGRILEAVCPQRIVVTLPERRRAEVMPALLEARGRGIVVEDAVDVYERVTGKLAIEALPPASLVFSKGFRVSRGPALVGRALSLVAASVALVVVAPLIGLIALAVKLDSRGPVFFHQDRIGLHGRRFSLIKFRTMRPVTAERSVWVRDNEDRITRAGRVLRKFRLDELPQFWNVVRGDMNLVGPRPHPVVNYELFAREIPYYALRAAVRPGVTGWAQVRYGYANNLDEETEKMRYDLFYVKHLSVWLDLRILVDTVKVVVFGLGSRSADVRPGLMAAPLINDTRHATSEDAA